MKLRCKKGIIDRASRWRRFEVYPPVAKLDIAADSDSEGRGFESLRAGQVNRGRNLELRNETIQIRPLFLCCRTSISAVFQSLSPYGRDSKKQQLQCKNETGSVLNPECPFYIGSSFFLFQYSCLFRLVFLLGRQFLSCLYLCEFGEIFLIEILQTLMAKTSDKALYWW